MRVLRQSAGSLPCFFLLFKFKLNNPNHFNSARTMAKSFYQLNKNPQLTIADQPFSFRTSNQTIMEESDIYFTLHYNLPSTIIVCRITHCQHLQNFLGYTHVCVILHQVNQCVIQNHSCQL